MQLKSGFYTTTYKIRLYTNHLNYIKNTEAIYNQVILNYYNLLFDNLEFLNLSNQNCLRELEKLTIKSKTGETPTDYIEQDIPMYLRRAAINQAIGYVRSYQTALNNQKIRSSTELLNKTLNENQETKITLNKAIAFHSPILLYKGMYKDLYEDSITIKLFDGKNWRWFPTKIKTEKIKNTKNKETKINENVEILSPSIVVKKELVMLHIPIKEEIEDVTPIKERMKQEQVQVCGISFSNTDSFVICVAINENKDIIKTKFIKGGNEYRNATHTLLAKIKKHKQNGQKFTPRDHKHYWEKLNNISDYYAHKVSKEIIKFCTNNNIKIIAIADMEEDVSKHFGKKVGKYSPIYLRKRIVQYLQYKAFKQGILITKVRRNYTASKCYICRSQVKRNNNKYICENGHQGDYFFNSAMNIAIMCLKKFGK